MRRFLTLFSILFFICKISFAATVPVSKMQNALSGVTQQKMQSGGFMTIDPRYNRTQVAIGGLAIGYAAEAVTVTALGITAPAWASVAGIAIAGYAGFLALDAGIKWIFKDSGNVQIGDDPVSINTPAGLAPPSKIYYVGNVIGTSPTAACNGQPVISGSLPGDTTWTRRYAWDGSQCIGWQTNTNTVTGKVYPEINTGPVNMGVSNGNTTQCPGINLSATGGKCPASNFAEPNAAPVKPIGDAIADIPEQEKLKPLNPQIIADLANEMWREAALAPGYDGLPYDATKPITAADAATWQAANPSYWPTVGDFVAPQPAPSGGSAGSPFSMPTASTPVSTQDPTSTPETGTNPSTEPLQNLGPDPGIGAPALESIPTAQQILQPLLNLFPTLKNFAVPNHSSACPKWTIPLLNHDYVMQDHCPILENIRPTLYSVMAVVWLLIALFIVLAA